MENISLFQFVRNRRYDDLLSAIRSYPKKLDQRTNDGWYITHMLARYGDNDATCLKEALKAKTVDVNWTCYEGTTALHQAILGNKLAAVQVLVNCNGICTNGKDNYDRTPLILAAELSNSEITELLLKHGADVHASDFRNETALHITAREGFLEVCRVLLNHGALLCAKVDTVSLSLT